MSDFSAHDLLHGSGYWRAVKGYETMPEKIVEIASSMISGNMSFGHLYNGRGNRN